MAENDYSSLREAVNRIIGAPPGGGAQDQSQEVVQFAPKAPYSQELENVAPGGIRTTSAISNTPFDPYAAEKAAAAAAAAAPVAVAAPVVAAAPPAAASSGNAVAQGGTTTQRPTSTGFLTDPNYVFKSPAAPTYAPSANTVSNTAAVRSAPVNPGPGAPWQKSQQYWRDLAAYKG